MKKKTSAYFPKEAILFVFFILTAVIFSRPLSAATPVPIQSEKQQKTIAIDDLQTHEPDHDHQEIPEDFLNQTTTLQKSNDDPKMQAMEDALKKIINKNCTEKIDGKRSNISCFETKENGAVIKTETFIAEEVDEYKKQTVISETSPSGNRMTKKSIRHKVQYDFKDSQKEVNTEYFDVVTRSTHEPVIRELMIRQYDPQTHKVTKLTWTKYRQIEESKFAEIENHVALSFSPSGEPLRGRVEKWRDGQVSKTVARWNPSNLRFQSAEWKNWQNQISAMMNQVVIA